MSGDSQATQFIAYCYPAWHLSDSRPGVNEWNLYDRFEPYFPGHERIPYPADGPYDDTDPATARKQIAIASSKGIAAFTYFLFFGPNGFMMTTPVQVALEEAAEAGCGFMVGTTWCLRLPHASFPLPIEVDGTGLATANDIGPGEGQQPATIGELADAVGVSELYGLALGKASRLAFRDTSGNHSPGESTAS